MGVDGFGTHLNVVCPSPANDVKRIKEVLKRAVSRLDNSIPPFSFFSGNRIAVPVVFRNGLGRVSIALDWRGYESVSLFAAHANHQVIRILVLGIRMVEMMIKECSEVVYAMDGKRND